MNSHRYAGLNSDDGKTCRSTDRGEIKKVKIHDKTGCEHLRTATIQAGLKCCRGFVRVLSNNSTESVSWLEKNVPSQIGDHSRRFRLSRFAIYGM
jgi:hypothetical protein